MVPNLKLKIFNENGAEQSVGARGEIGVKGDNVIAGYWKNEKATGETIRDGWRCTGDIGYIDANGFLYVLGREKSLLIGHDREKFSPEEIEEILAVHSPYIEHVMFYNSQSAYTSALIVPNREAILNNYRSWVFLRIRRKDRIMPSN